MLTCLWTITFLSIPLLSIVGRQIQLAVYDSVPLGYISFSIHFVLVGLVCVYLVLLMRAGAGYDVWHLLWLAVLSYFLYGELHFVEKIHMALFGSFGFFSYQLFKRHLAVVVCIGLSVLDELLQYFLVIRVGDWRDVRLNLFSSFLGLFLAYLLLKNRGKKSVGSRTR